MDKKRTVELLEELFGRLTGCSDPTCHVCKNIKAQINELGTLLELAPTEMKKITPWWLRERGEQDV